MIKISTSILSTENRQIAIKKLNETTTDYIHIDTMDGNFVNNYQLPINEIVELNKITKKPFDVHLMVNNPQEYIEKLANLNIEYITFHLEINHNIHKIINMIKNLGYKVGLSINPKTNIEAIIPYLNHLDMVLIMSVEPGQGGQSFIPNSLDKAQMIRQYNSHITIEMDGGIKDHNINEIKKYVDIAVVGSYITNQDNYQEAINNLKN